MNPTRLYLLIGSLFALAVGEVTAKPLIVDAGRANAQIVIAEKPPRMTRLAVEQLQNWVERITGATLSIVHTPTAGNVHIFVGRSSYTDALGITDDGLDYGAYHIKSGDNWLALIGRDVDFVPPEPWARSRSDGQRAYEAWQKLAGGDWGNGIGGKLYRMHSGRLDIWQYDLGGSLNAVNGFLHELGVRFYMPGELGTVLPETETIALPDVDRTVKPSFAMRHMAFAHYYSTPEDDILWYLRLGLNHGYEIAGPGDGGIVHGMRSLTSSPTMKSEHPEYYALYAGKRETERRNAGKSCMSSEGLMQEHARYVRAVFDVYDPPMVSIMPHDGFNTVCECPLCEGKEQPERGQFGRMSNYVWDYLNRVAQEVYKTHPHKKVSSFAYGTYTLPPTHIEKLSPNLVIGFVHGRDKHYDEPEARARIDEIRNGWLQLTDNPLIMWEHYVFTQNGTYIPIYFPHAIAEGLRSLDGKCYGEFVEVAIGPFDVRGHGLHQPGFNHLNIYVTSRMYWDAQQDVDALLAEYYDLFYGPAASEMKAFVDYCESTWPNLQGQPAPNEVQDVVAKIDRIFALLDVAVTKVPADSDYAKRIDLVVDYLKPLHNRRVQLSSGRQNTPKLRIVRNGDEFTVDGKLDEPFWQNAQRERLLELQTGREPSFGTIFQMSWDTSGTTGALRIAITCEESDIAGIIAPADGDDDGKIWMGDAVEVLIETQPHSYYQFTIDPSGRVYDLDRKGGAIVPDWTGGAEVATHVGDGQWTVEMRIPITGTETTGDPKHEVVGVKPTERYPWFINVCRQRVRDNGTALSAWSPTGKNSFHVVSKFGKLYVR